MIGKLKFLLLIIESVLPSSLRCLFMRWRGATIGRGVKLKPGAIFQCGKVTMGDGVVIGPFTWFRVSEELTLGERVKVGPFTRLTARRIVLGNETTVGNSVLISGGGRFAELVCGPRCFIATRTYVELTRKVTMGIEVAIGGSSLIFTHGSWQSELEGFPVTVGEVELGDFVWLSWNVIVLSGVKVGDFALVGAGAVVRGDVPAYCVAAGNPARVLTQPGQHLRTLTEDERYAICRGILAELMAHHEWQGSRVQAAMTDGECRVEVDGEMILLVPDGMVNLAVPVAAVISLDRMSDTTILALEGTGTDWFDIARRRCSRPRSDVHGMIRSSFSQHGIRFELTNRGAVSAVPDVKKATPPPMSPAAK